MRDVTAEVEVLDLGGETRREGAGVKMRNDADAALPFELRAVQAVHAVTQGGDNAHAGDDDASSHVNHYRRATIECR